MGREQGQKGRKLFLKMVTQIMCLSVSDGVLVIAYRL